MTITLLDPSLDDNKGNESKNLGDLIIFESIQKVLTEIFKDFTLHRISTKKPFSTEGVQKARSSDYIFIGGTNLISWNVYQFSWYHNLDTLFWLFPKVKSIILLGVGYGHGYPLKPNFKSQIFYNLSLKKRITHSVRDEFTAKMLKSIGISNVINTACPTMWALNNRVSNRQDTKKKYCLFTLTDYAESIDSDNKLITTLLDFFDILYFFPQGSLDINYIKTLKSYINNKSKIVLLPHSYSSFLDFLKDKQGDITYVGTRLHGGIKCIENNIDSLIIGIDNRAKEIYNDTHIPVVDRLDTTSLQSWLNGDTIFNKIELPILNIEKWKSQFQT